RPDTRNIHHLRLASVNCRFRVHHVVRSYSIQGTTSSEYSRNHAEVGQCIHQPCQRWCDCDPFLKICHSGKKNRQLWCRGHLTSTFECVLFCIRPGYPRTLSGPEAVRTSKNGVIQHG